MDEGEDCASGSAAGGSSLLLDEIPDDLKEEEFIKRLFSPARVATAKSNPSEEEELFGESIFRDDREGMVGIEMGFGVPTEDDMEDAMEAVPDVATDPFDDSL